MEGKEKYQMSYKKGDQNKRGGWKMIKNIIEEGSGKRF